MINPFLFKTNQFFTNSNKCVIICTHYGGCIMKDSELRKRARDLTNTLSTLDIYYNVLEENIKGIKTMYNEADEEEQERIINYVISQLFSPAVINSRSSKKDEVLEKRKVLFSKLLNNENTLDFRSQLEIQKLIYTYRSNIDKSMLEIQDDGLSDIDIEDILGTPGSRITFKASDGKEFKTREEAIIHNQKVSDELRENLKSKDNNRHRTR